MKTFLIILVYILLIGPALFYIKDIIKGKSKPSKSTRIIYFTITLTTFLQQYDLKVGDSKHLMLAEFSLSCLLLCFAFWKGVGGLKKLDIICYILFIITFIIWKSFDNTLLALFFSLMIDVIGTVPTIYKTYKDPSSETPIFWGIGSFAPIVGFLIQPEYTVAAIAVPLYLLVINLSVFALSLRSAD